MKLNFLELSAYGKLIIIIIIFDQMGKFYELFEMDAHIGARELDLQYMKVVTFYLC